MLGTSSESSILVLLPVFVHGGGEVGGIDASWALLSIVSHTISMKCLYLPFAFMGEYSSRIFLSLLNCDFANPYMAHFVLECFFTEIGLPLQSMATTSFRIALEMLSVKLFVKLSVKLSASFLSSLEPSALPLQFSL